MGSGVPRVLYGLSVETDLKMRSKNKKICGDKIKVYLRLRTNCKSEDQKQKKIIKIF